MMKPTIVNLLFAAILLVGLATNRLFLKTVFAEAFDLEDEGWSKLTLRFGLYFIFLAGVNEIVWRTQSEDVWTSFKVFGIAPLTIVFMLLQGRLVERYTRPKS
jgi:intracellular septation protein